MKNNDENSLIAFNWRQCGFLLGATLDIPFQAGHIIVKGWARINFGWQGMENTYENTQHALLT